MSQLWRRTSCHPSARSRRKRCAAGFAYGVTCIAATKITLKRKLPASIAKTHPAPATATMAPARAGPKTFVVLRESEISAFACCNRPALTVWGMSALEAGLKNPAAAPAMPCNIASCQTCAVPAKRSTAVVACVPSRTRSAPIITARRGSRSAQTPPASVTAAPPIQ